jgi:hypothetical protein
VYHIRNVNRNYVVYSFSETGWAVYLKHIYGVVVCHLRDVCCLCIWWVGIKPRKDPVRITYPEGVFARNHLRRGTLYIGCNVSGYKWYYVEMYSVLRCFHLILTILCSFRICLKIHYVGRCAHKRATHLYAPFWQCVVICWRLWTGTRTGKVTHYVT